MPLSNDRGSRIRPLRHISRPQYRHRGGYTAGGCLGCLHQRRLHLAQGCPSRLPGKVPRVSRGERLRDRSNPDPAAAKAVTALALTRVPSARPARTGVGDQRRFVSFVRDDSAGVGMGRGMAPNENQEPGKTLTPLGVSPARRETVPGLVAELDGGKARISPRAGKAFRSWLCPPVLRTVSVTNFSRIRGVLRLPEAVRSVARGATEC